MTRTDHLLVILAEECNEVAQLVAKALRFGTTEVESKQALTNAERIADEVGDLLGVLDMLAVAGKLDGVNSARVTAARAGKPERVEEYLKKSAQLGRLVPTRAGKALEAEIVALKEALKVASAQSDKMPARRMGL